MPINELKDGTKWIKATYWDDNDLKGEWLITYKIDGVRCIRNKNGDVCTRDTKPVTKLNHLDVTDSEFYYKDWSTSIGILHRREHPIIPTQEMLYSLDPIDPRLIVGTVKNPNSAYIRYQLEVALSKGYEGLVLRQGNKWIKVVPEKFADVFILDIKKGNGKYSEVASTIVTSRGKVASFELQGLLSDIEFRKELLINRESYIGKIAQIGYRELTKNGKFRFPRLVRLRLDKDYESI